MARPLADCVLETLNETAIDLASYAQVQDFDRLRQGAVSLLTESSVHQALDVTNADAKSLIATAATPLAGRC